MKSLLIRLAIAAPLTLGGLLLPFLLALWIETRFGRSLPLVFPLVLGLGIAYVVFFAIAGKQMKQVDEQWRKNRK